MSQIRGIIFDVDGTLVDSNDANAHAWVESMAEQGYKVPFDEVRPLIDMGGDKVLPQTFGIAKEVNHSKPDPDVMSATFERSGYSSQELVMIGDTAYDIEAAAKVKIKTIAFRCGGWSDTDLAGAVMIYDGPADLLAHYDESLLVKGI